MTTLSLIRHPSAPAPHVHAVSVEIRPPAAGRLLLRYRIEGDIGELRLPASSMSRRADELWKHTCFEAFVGKAGGAEYYELNFSPSTEWAMYRFDGYRQGMEPVAPPRAPSIVCTARAGSFDADVEVQLDALEELRGAALRVGLSAVIEDNSGRMSYWALAHPASRPDFHHAGSFACSMRPPSKGHTP